MSRGYPAFIYQKVTGAQSTGEFIISTLSPRFIAKVHLAKGSPELIVLEHFEECTDEALGMKLQKMKKWFIHSHYVTAQEETGLLIHDAYRSFIQTVAVSELLDLSRSTISHLKKNINEKSIFPKHETMRSHLEKGGWKMISEERWEPQ